MTNEAFSRVKIDAQLRDQAWEITNTNAVRFEYVLPDRTKADYVLCDRNGRSLAVVEAKKAAINPAEAEDQAKAYAAQLKVPYIFLANGNEIRFWEWQTEAFPRPVKTFFSQGDLERRAATAQVKRDVLSVDIDKHIVERDYQTECIDALCREFKAGRRKLLVEMATGTGKTRTAAAFIKRLFEAGAITRVLFLVDRIPLAKQTEDAFAEHLSDFPAYVLRAGRRFQDEKRITITTLQSMVNVYRDYSSGYFDLIITDECHRSIYGKWSGVLKHFDGIQIGLTATPCVADEAASPEDAPYVRDTLKFFELDKPTFSYGIRQAIDEGYLVPYQVYKAKTVKTAAKDGFHVQKDELDWGAMDPDTRSELTEAFGDQKTITVDPSALERRFTIPERNRAIVREYKEVMQNGYLDAKGHKRKPVPGKTVVFAVTKRHAETLARMFDDAFADEKPHPSIRFADYVVSETSGDDTQNGMAKIRQFKKEAFPKILVSVNMLDTGFDFPELQNIVFARFTQSAILYRQMRGRGSRKAPGKALFTMFDFVGVTDLHEGDEGPVVGGAIRISEPMPQPPQPRRLLALDINDQIDPTTRAWVTMDSNGNLVDASDLEALSLMLGAKFEGWMLPRETHFNAEQRRWLALIGNTIRANADTLDDFSPDHLDVFQAFIALGGQARARQVFCGSTALLAVLDSLSFDVFSPPETTTAQADFAATVSLQ
jgi:type I restriction enzyme R subunit